MMAIHAKVLYELSTAVVFGLYVNQELFAVYGASPGTRDHILHDSFVEYCDALSQCNNAQRLLSLRKQLQEIKGTDFARIQFEKVIKNDKDREPRKETINLMLILEMMMKNIKDL